MKSPIISYTPYRRFMDTRFSLRFRFNESTSPQVQALTRKEQTELLLSPEQMKIWRCFLLGGEWSRKTLSEKSGVNLKTTE